MWKRTIQKEINLVYVRICYREQQNIDKINHWLETGETGCKIATTLRKLYQRLYRKKNNKMCYLWFWRILGIVKNYTLFLDHIDGDASNKLERQPQIDMS